MSNISPAGRIVPLQRGINYWGLVGLIVGPPVVLCGLGWLAATILSARPLL
jgi:predicted PurR-regulated permease PerM